jgi:hypothetical protein
MLWIVYAFGGAILMSVHDVRYVRGPAIRPYHLWFYVP